MDIARAGAGANTDATSARITVVVIASVLVAARARCLRRAARTPEPSSGVIIVIVVVVVDPLARSSSRVVVAVVVVMIVVVVVVERERDARASVESHRVASRRIRRAGFSLSPVVLFFLYFSRIIHQIVYSRVHYERRAP